MENKKLVSVRIDADDLREIDRLCEIRPYGNRSDFLQLGAKVMIEIYKAGLFSEVLRYRPQFGDVIDEIKFKYHRKPR